MGLFGYPWARLLEANATKARQITKNYFREYLKTSQRGQADETGNCNCLLKSRQVSQKQEQEEVKSKNVPTDKTLYARVKAEAKRRFKVYPSAYANGWLVREYKKRGGGYKSVKSGKNG